MNSNSKKPAPFVGSGEDVRKLPLKPYLWRAYKMGYDCGRNGPNSFNCDFQFFHTKEHTTEWERGKRDAEEAC